MVFNKFFFKILVRVVLLTIALVIVSLLFAQLEFMFTQLILFVVIIGQVVELTIFINQTNYDLARFVSSIKDGDYTINFSNSGKNKSFRSLNRSFNEFAELLQHLSSRNESQLHFLNLLVDQIEFGILVFDNNDQITLMNKHARSLLELPKVRIWENLQNANINFIKIILELPESKKQLIETKIASRDRFFSVSKLSVIIDHNNYRIFSFQDIRSEIQNKEIEAWQKLIRVLTHEIMNSVTPLVSLTQTIQMILTSDDNNLKQANEITEQNITDVIEALFIIQERGNGIISFVENYRKLTRIPKPEFLSTNISSLISNVVKLQESIFEKAKIEILQEPDNNLISIDKALIEQVVINILKNATEALSETTKPRILIAYKSEVSYFTISITNNGAKIPTDQLNKIFVPFYSTKIDGSGVGLSVSRQIMHAHGGFLEVSSSLVETIFFLHFPILS